MRILKNVLLRKSRLKFLESIKTKKFISQHHVHQLAEIWLRDVWSIHILILQSSSKSVKRSAIFHSSIWRPLHFKNILFCEFLTQFDPISWPPIAFLLAAAKINNIDTLKICRKVTKITDPNLWFFLAMGRIQRWNSWQNFKNYWFKLIFIDGNCLLW